MDEASNKADLMAELNLLVHGQYFAESFAKRAQTYKIWIPSKISTVTFSSTFVDIILGIRWNCTGAFIGEVDDFWLDDTSSLIFGTFLAAPFLDTSGVYKERKFSGSTAAGHSIDIVGSAIDAYAHHTLVDSNGALLLTDLQGNFYPKLVKIPILMSPFHRCRWTRTTSNFVRPTGTFVCPRSFSAVCYV